VFLYDGDRDAEALCKHVRRDLSARVNIESVPPPTRLAKAPEGTASHVTSAMFLKILAPALLVDRYERVLCLDSDTLVTGDIADLLETDLEGECLGGVADGYAYAAPDERGYFNAGVLLIDTGAYRR
jgi:lipopolysaccharide biosynthesis glycosyltransferase